MCSFTPSDQSLSYVFFGPHCKLQKKKKGFDMCPLVTPKKICSKLLSVNIFIKGYIRSDDGAGNENVKKAIGLITATLQVLHAFFCTFLCRHCCARLRRKYDYLEDVNKRRRNFLPHMNLDINSRNSAPGEVACI